MPPASPVVFDVQLLYIPGRSLLLVSAAFACVNCRRLRFLILPVTLLVCAGLEADEEET